MRVGILGAGNISETHARAAAAIPGTEIVAVTGKNLARAERLASAYGAKAYDDLDAFLSHRPMDVVAIGSPSGLHAEQGIAACRRGLHVLVEKPIDISVDRADALIDAARTAGVTLGVFFQDHVQPDLVRLQEAIAAGRLGRPMLASARVKWYRPPEYYGQSKWRGTWTLDGGGALMNQGIHTADLLLWLLGPVRRVAARTATSLHAIEVEDTVVVEHDRLVAADLREPAEDLLVAAPEDQNASASSPVVSDARGHQRLFEDFFDAVAAGREPRCSGRYARQSVALVQAIYEAARASLWVSVPSVSSVPPTRNS